MKTYKLYDGSVELLFNEEKHLYSIEDNKVDGVTGILGVISKPALMYWAVNMAIEHLKQALHAGVGYDELQIKQMLDEAKIAHRKKSTEAADIGKMTHEWIEKWIAKENPATPINPQIKNATDMFLGWVKDHKVKFLESEKVVYSKKYGYAGIMDFLCEYEGKKMVGDIKTSTGIYDEYWYQVSAYYQAYHEEFPKVNIDGAIIVRIGKDASIDFEENEEGDLEKDLIAFNSAINLFRRQNERKDIRFAKKNKN